MSRDLLRRALVAVLVLVGLGSAPAVATTHGEIAFLRDGGRTGIGLYAVNANDSGWRRLERSVSQASPAWSADHSQLAFLSRRGVLTVLDVTGGGSRRLTSTPVDSFGWSSDGAMLAYAGTSPFVGDGYGIWVVRPDGGGRRRVATVASFTSQLPASLSWSPDGRWLAFAARGGRLHVMRTDGSGRGRVSSFKGFDRQPSWSPDGRWIAVVTSPRGVTGPAEELSEEIAVMHPDFTARRVLTHNHVPDRDLAWSPDGRRIAFSQGDGISVVRPSSGARRLSPAHASDFRPAWAPDGRRIAFLEQVGSKTMLSVMNADGSGRRVVARACCSIAWASR